MAKFTKQMNFSNCEINLSDGLLCEHNKEGDTIGTYRLHDILSAWDGVYGVNVSISLKDDMPTIERVSEFGAENEDEEEYDEPEA